MLRMSKNSIFNTIVYLALVIFIFNAAPFAQEKKGEDIEKKYAPIVGDYEFDMSDTEMGVMIVTFYVESGALWAQPDTSDQPGEIIPVEGKKFEFTHEDPEEGTYEVKFLKDDEGKYTKCHVVNVTIGMDVTGVKLKKDRS